MGKGRNLLPLWTTSALEKLVKKDKDATKITILEMSSALFVCYSILKNDKKTLKKHMVDFLKKEIEKHGSRHLIKTTTTTLALRIKIKLTTARW